MNKYIDAGKLIAEIEKRQEARQDVRDSASWENEYWPEGEFSTRDDEDNAILSIITSLQQEQPEVDIEKEIAEHAENMPHGEFTHESECVEHEEWAKREFRHFYELGLKARK